MSEGLVSDDPEQEITVKTVEKKILRPQDAGSTFLTTALNV